MYYIEIQLFKDGKKYNFRICVINNFVIKKMIYHLKSYLKNIFNCKIKTSVMFSSLGLTYSKIFFVILYFPNLN